MISSGWQQTVATVVIGAMTLLIVVMSGTVHRGAVVQVATLAMALLVIGVLVGSVSISAAATVPAIGSVMIEILAGASQTWVRSIVVGCLWYVVMELAWDSIERRDVSVRSRAVIIRRAQEVVTVVTLALGIGLIALLMSSLAPVRTLPVQALILIGFFTALIAAVRHLAATADTESATQEGS